MKKFNALIFTILTGALVRGGGGNQNLRGPNTLPGYICMEKIIILWSDCESWGGKHPSCPPCSASPGSSYASKKKLMENLIQVRDIEEYLTRCVNWTRLIFQIQSCMNLFVM